MHFEYEFDIVREYAVVSENFTEYKNLLSEKVYEYIRENYILTSHGNCIQVNSMDDFKLYVSILCIESI